MKSFRIAVLSLLCLFAAYTTIPDRFTQNESIYPNCGYHAEPLGDTGFALETFLKQYSFGPSAEAAIQSGRECFAKTATFVAQNQGKKIAHLTAAEMNTSTTRNAFDAHFSVYVTGKIAHLK
jgi:hypothetical protein